MIVLDMFCHLPLRPAQSGHLRRMRYHKDLSAIGQGLQTAPNRIGRRTTHTAVNLVKDQRQPMCTTRQTDFEGQQKPGELSARGYFFDWARWRTWIGRNFKGHIILSARTRCTFPKDNPKICTLHLQRGQFIFHCSFKSLSGQFSGFTDLRRNRQVLRFGLGKHIFQPSHFAIASFDLIQFSAEAIGKCRQFVGQDIVLTRQPADRKEPLFNTFKFHRVKIKMVQTILDTSLRIAKFFDRPLKRRDGLIKATLSLS